MSEEPPFSHWLKLLPVLNEAQVRWYAAVKALELGRGGIERVHEASGLARAVIRRGIQEVSRDEPLDLSAGIRQKGAGRPRAVEKDSTLVPDLKRLLEENTAGDPMSLLQWTSKSTRTLAEELVKQGHQVSRMTVERLLEDLDYSQQGNRKNKEGVRSQERDDQFRYINAQVKRFVAEGEPVLSIDCKKKELVGEFKNAGKTWRKKGEPRDVNVYDFPRLGKGKAIPYGVYDVRRNDGFVNVGISHETAEFAVESLRLWWRKVGRARYPDAKRLLLCADGGGSNGSRNRAWKLYVQDLADETGLAVSVCHYHGGELNEWSLFFQHFPPFSLLNSI